MNNISNIQDCYGCGVCATVCAKHIISIQLNDDGFYEPRISDESKCSDCGLCLEVCAYSHDDLSLKDRCIKSYGAWSKDEAVRRKCSSGGVGFELGRTLIGEGYKVCGVRYNAELNRAEHYIATTVEEMIPSIGSKYIQSYTVDGFNAIDPKQKYLITGTPCQIDSFRWYIQKFKKEDNFVLMDFFCHGVPSKLMWDKYVKWAETKVGKITYVSWRNKFTGWHDSWAMAIEGNNSTVHSRLSENDMFYRLFLSDACLGKACYDKCKYKYGQSAADIRIGDAWGEYFKEDDKGTSAVLALTEKGNDLLSRCNIQTIGLPIDVIAEWQMKTNPQRVKLYNAIMRDLKNPTLQLEVSFARVMKEIKLKKMIGRFRNPFRSIQNLLRKI